MKREITDHRCGGNINDIINVFSTDLPGNGGAHHQYTVELPAGEFNLQFQDGPIQEVGVNGITNEALLAIVEDRLRCFQSGAYPSRENAIALTHIQDALHWLHHRTRERMARGVEGKSAA